jgi:hypothetical protein
MITSTQDARNDGAVRLITGHESEKFCRYTTWQKIEKSILGRGRESAKYRRACSMIIT